MIIGLIVLLVSALLGLGGFIARMSMERMAWSTNRMLWIRFGHRALGYLMIAGSQFAILTGGFRYSESGNKLSSILCIIHFIGIILMFIIFETVFRIHRRKETPFDDISTSISRTEFEQRVS